MKLLSECWQTLAMAGLRDTKHVFFTGKAVRTKLVQCAITIAISTIVGIQVIICVKNRHNGFHKLLHPIHLVFALFSMLLIYVSLLAKIDEINQLIRYLQHIILEREQFSHISCFVFSSIFFFQLFRTFSALFLPFFIITCIRFFLFSSPSFFPFSIYFFLCFFIDFYLSSLPFFEFPPFCFF